MKEIIFNKQLYQHYPYGLHDAVITEIRMRGETVELSFREGIVENEDPFARTGPAVIEIRNVDPDFCTISWYRTSVKEKQKLKGRRLALTDYISLKGAPVTVVSETHGFNRVCYRGYMFRRNKGSRTPRMVEVELDLYYFGDLVYKLEESK